MPPHAQPARGGRLRSGPGRDRTADLLGAIQARSQLRYGPVRKQNTRITTIGGAGALRGEVNLDGLTIARHIEFEEVARLEVKRTGY